MVWFFGAVLLVMVGTYCIFTAGSIALLKALRANHNFYYQTRHFTAVSGMLYRMKQNAAGLSNICILSTMVLVTVSTTACLYFGLEQMAAQRAAENALSTAEAAEMLQEYAVMYGGFLFLGLFLGAVFLLATVLIIYYKQLSEGYEDRDRYRIMQQVGMTPEEVRGSIRSSDSAGIFPAAGHGGAASVGGIPHALPDARALRTTERTSFAACAGGTLAVFCIVYALVFILTARTYNRVVRETE